MKYPAVYLRFHFLLDTYEMTAQQLAEKSGVGKSSISHYVNGAHEPSPETARKIAQVFGVNPLWIRGFDVPMKLSEGAAEDQLIAQKLRLLSYANKLRVLERIDMLLEQQEGDQ